jgi:RNA polymerase sigma factor (sigma-70 family)
VRRDLWRDEGRLANQTRIDSTEGFDISGGGNPAATMPPDLREAIWRCVGQLNERQRQVTIMKFRHDLTAEQIGVRVSMSAGHVRVTLLRAIRRLRTCLGIGGEP